ncbi:MAG: Obg family GTPase CgtA [Caldilineaceae bacterium]
MARRRGRHRTHCADDHWDYYEATMRFQRILRAMGIADALREAGVQEGDRVQIADVELIWGYDNALDD